MSLFHVYSPFDALRASSNPFLQLLEPDMNVRHADHHQRAAQQQAEKDDQLERKNAPGSRTVADRRAPWWPSLLQNGSDISIVQPRVDMHATDEGYILSAEVPGCNKEDVHLDVDEQARRISLWGTIKSEYSNESGGKDAADKATSSSKTPRTLITERMYGSFSRSWVLPDAADLSRITATRKDGILNVSIPFHKNNEAANKPRAVTIEDAREDE